MGHCLLRRRVRRKPGGTYDCRRHIHFKNRTIHRILFQFQRKGKIHIVRNVLSALFHICSQLPGIPAHKIQIYSPCPCTFRKFPLLMIHRRCHNNFNVRAGKLPCRLPLSCSRPAGYLFVCRKFNINMQIRRTLFLNNPAIYPGVRPFRQADDCVIIVWHDARISCFHGIAKYIS